MIEDVSVQVIGVTQHQETSALTDTLLLVHQLIFLVIDLQRVSHLFDSDDLGVVMVHSAL